MGKYVIPELRARQFTCPSCGTFAQQDWSDHVHYGYRDSGRGGRLPLQWCHCTACGFTSIWSTETNSPILPRVTGAPMAHKDLPECCRKDYEEARVVVSDSPRAAAAILRLCVQRLTVELGGKGKKIDDDIAMLVAKGLPPLVQQALDICRVVGNNSVHPGELNVDDTPELVAQLFEMINFIVAQTIERENAIKAMYAKLPGGALAAIERRDGASVVALP